ncbi:MAG: molybdenum ABC transporter ATP-binding protein [Phycisphaerales bacterium]|nr:molybdenum ABC transporter ATP-binding protein [Phycisphaerae bacterium]NNF42990.1 molybdenum ABC transporter ATP-binding protein [Phycisphaerales bacterium]NNM25389.1 molybdenum ABC transporter ATP-binding protein [Phycisphaerales bacterium]
MRLDVDITVRRGDAEASYAFATDDPVLGVFGRSGAGKTTLLHAIAGLVRPASGRIAIDGERLFDCAARFRRAVHRRRLGVIFQEDRLLPHRRVRGNLAYARRGSSPASVDAMAHTLGLGALLDRRIDGLSGGERRRVAIGRALLAEPRVLLLDEPLTSLDVAMRGVCLEAIRRRQRELDAPMLYVSHDLSELLSLTDRILVIEDGRTVGCGPITTLARERAAWTALRGAGALNVVRLQVRSHDATAGLTRFTLADGSETGSSLLGPLSATPSGATVTAALRADDIALALAEIPGISIRNQLPGRVTHVTAHADRSVVEVDIGVSILVEISHQAVAQMQLTPGREVRALIKSNALEYVG